MAMKLKTLFVLCVAVIGFASCSKSEIEYKNDFAKSHSAWMAFKAANNDSYRFVVTGSSWAGYSWETTLTVVNGITIERKFKYTRFYNMPMPQGGWTAQARQELLDAINITEAEFQQSTGQTVEATLQWTETGAMVGTRGQTSATSFLTLDEIYKQAQNDWLQKRSNASTYFEKDNNGMISTCGYVEHNCADDCFIGIYISRIEAL